MLWAPLERLIWVLRRSFYYLRNSKSSARKRPASKKTLDFAVAKFWACSTAKKMMKRQQKHIGKKRVLDWRLKIRGLNKSYPYHFVENSTQCHVIHASCPSIKPFASLGCNWLLTSYSIAIDIQVFTFFCRIIVSCFCKWHSKRVMKFCHLYYPSEP